MKLWLPSLVLFTLLGPVVPLGAAEIRRTEVPQPSLAERGGFTLMPPEASGVCFTNHLAPQRHHTNQIPLNGSGVACGDVDGDGLVDLYFCHLDGPNALFRNLGHWKFENITTSAGVACDGLDATSAVLADLDGDGDLDLTVSSIAGGTRLFFNNGRARFTESASVLNGNSAGMSMALADLDGNGSLDLYIANYRTVTLRDQPNSKFSIQTLDGEPRVTAINGRPLTAPEFTNRFTFRVKVVNGVPSMGHDEHGEVDGVFLNDGKGRFTPLSFTSGAFLDEAGQPLTRPPFDWGLSVMIRDLNGDGAPDIYVCNDFKSPDRIWINDGKGRFRAMASTAIRQISLSSMGVDVADVNRDGHFDVFVADMLSPDHLRRMTQKPDMNPEMLPIGDTTARVQTARNTLLLARGDGTFAEVAQFAGVAATDWSWTPVFLDVDLDGYEDLLVSNGFERDGMNMDALRQIDQLKAGRKLPPLEALALRARFPRLDTPNIALRNLGNGRFADASKDWGFHQRGVSQGMAAADLDNDGDIDVVINNMNGPAFLLRNNASAPRLAVRLKGLAPNTRGIGAKISVSGGPVTQMQEMICGGRYLSSDDPMRVFAAGSLSNKLRLEVTWRGGRRSVVENALPNSIYEISEDSAFEVQSSEFKVQSSPVWFSDVSTLLNHRHSQVPTADFALQPLLSRHLTQSGPGLSWTDVDGDGFADLLIGSAPEGVATVFRNDGRGRFTRTNAAMATANAGPFALADVDGDGLLELFSGGRAIPSRYPETTSSTLSHARAGRSLPGTDRELVFTNLGLVTAAVFTDLDGDGAPDLVAACDWGPLKIFRNLKGKLTPWNPPVTTTLNSQLSTLSHLTGWWTSVTSGDFDGDGRMDIVAANWGENTKFEQFRARPLRLYHGDFDGDGVVELIESCFDPATQRYVPARQLDVMEHGMPSLRARFNTWESWSRAGMDDVLGENAATARVLEAAWLSTTVFLNRGDRFEVVRLPDEAQFAPAFGVCVTDFDGDGREDIFLAQNFFANAPDTSRHDAGRGLWLRGDGKGGFSSVPGQESGVMIYGEQRSAAVCDFDGDGRVDLCVSQNGAGTKLYRNTRAAPGLRVRLKGRPGNPAGVGAVLRVEYVDGQLGPSRELHTDSGWLSQDGPVPVLAAPRTIKALRVRWPGGKETTTSVPDGAKEITVEAAR